MSDQARAVFVELDRKTPIIEARYDDARAAFVAAARELTAHTARWGTRYAAAGGDMPQGRAPRLPQLVTQEEIEP